MISRGLRMVTLALTLGLAGCVTLASVSLRATEDRRGESLAGEITLTFSPRPLVPLPLPSRRDGKTLSPAEPACSP